MIDTIDLAALPAILLEARDTLPRISAVYFAVFDKEEVLYIGGTKNLRLRCRLERVRNWRE